MRLKNKALVIGVFALCVVGVFSQDGGSQKRRKLRRKLSDNPAENATLPVTDEVELNPSPPDETILLQSEAQETTERESRG